MVPTTFLTTLPKVAFDKIEISSSFEGGSLEAVKLILSNLEIHMNRPDLLREQMEISYDDVRNITKLPKAISNEENHQFPDILDFLKQNLSKYDHSNCVQKKESKSSKSSKAKSKIKKANSEVPKKETEMNGTDRITLKSDTMAQDVKNMEQIINQLRASKRNESADDLEAYAQSTQRRDSDASIPTSRKERSVQTCVTTKEKQIQTTADHTLSKQIEQKDRRISELEDALSKSRKKEEKLHKAEKELADARLKCQRQTKEISNLESYKKTAENHRAENEHLWEKYESLEQSYDVEKSRSADFEKMCHDLQNQLHQFKIDRNKQETRRNLDQRNEYEMKYRKKADRVNEFKEALRDLYKENLALEAALKTRPNKFRINQMATELRDLKLEAERSNDFEQNGSVTNYSALLQENNLLKKDVSKLRKELRQNDRFKDQIEKLETAGVTSCRICELDYEPIGDRKRCKLACTHMICTVCAKDWLSRNGLCPFCKHPFNHLEPIHLS
ncbi:Oidioi.mRNA.OKI2018_I69.XSR.g14347.t1.cds [Oikopleura dioica]|uniref:Oidioi.mRNA.OKI2018_I69.XSR.g14347.t1.cds n=1 Tax=Oikopleura dioica TaxID=34765 RepID=A0ABN7SGS8_OIKDI|nr:Oidioi.mRNA.OKI2018_I69.XSR.g14347.t1.cds [Oikopleura dioica]